MTFGAMETKQPLAGGRVFILRARESTGNRDNRQQTDTGMASLRNESGSNEAWHTGPNFPLPASPERQSHHYPMRPYPYGAQTRSSFTTLPWTSVSRKSRPA